MSGLLASSSDLVLDGSVSHAVTLSVDGEVVLDLFFGAAEHRLLLGHLPMTEAFIAEVVDVILGGIAQLAWFQLGS